MKRVLIFAFFFISFVLMAQVIYQPHRRNAFRSQVAFQPNQVAGLVWWWDASSIGSPTNANGYLVTNIYDRSTSANHLGASTGSGQQGYWTNNASRIGGKAWIDFDGVGNYYKGSTPAVYAQPSTYFVLMYYRFTAAIITCFSGTNGSLINSIGFSNIRQPRISAGTAFLGTIPVASNQWYLLECTFNGASSTIITNGVSNATGDAGAGSLSGITLGAPQSLSSYFPGGIAEVLVYNANVSSGDRTSIRNYFINKYGPYANW